jgi:hypothetical protein
MTIGLLQIALSSLDDRSRVKLIAQALIAVRRKRIIQVVDLLYVIRAQAVSLDDGAYKILERAELEAKTRIEQARVVTAANIATSVRMASDELEEVD